MCAYMQSHCQQRLAPSKNCTGHSELNVTFFCWQGGKEQERYCRFCRDKLPDWREAHAALPRATPIVSGVAALQRIRHGCRH